MKRIHLFEFEDMRWFPEALRNYGTDYLQYLSNKTKAFNVFVPKLLWLLEKRPDGHIIDLASGGGGGLIALNEELRLKAHGVEITLSDYFPNIQAFKHSCKRAGNFNYIAEPVDAMHVPAELKGVRTMFLSFHHFKPSQARQILQNAVDNRMPIGIFEGQERTPVSVIGMLFSPIAILLFTPFIRPFSFMRLLFTYLIPIVPLYVLWDGMVSVFRTYSVKEMQALIDSLEQKDTFEWECGKLKAKGNPAKLPYLCGRPMQ